MSANLKKYDRFIARCRQLLPQERITRLRNLALMVVSLLASTDCHLSSLAEVIPLEATDLSIEQRLRRWLKNQRINVTEWYMPFVKAALQIYQPAVVYVIMDTTQYGPACRALVVGIAYTGQIIPIDWRVVKGKKGHTDAKLQNELLTEIRPYLPPSRSVVLVADSEFSAVELLKPITDWGWQYIIRVKSSTLIHRLGEPMQPLAQEPLHVGQTRVWRRVYWTLKHYFGPLMVIGTWQPGEDVPLYVITNTDNPQAALLVYSWRFWIEPLFGDFKGRGFRLGLTRLRDPERLSRLLLVACIAFLWTLSVGSHIFHTPRQHWVDRANRNDRSFFQLGYRYLKRLLKLDQPLWITFQIRSAWVPVPLTL
jgi:hypothetical protein